MMAGREARLQTVVDASIAIPLIAVEPLRAECRAWVASVVEAGVELSVPAHFWLEVLNVLGRRLRYEGSDILSAIFELEELGLQTVDSDRPQLLHTLHLLERHGLTSYDAAYLALAETLDAQLATADATLARAAGPRAILFGGGAPRRLSEEPEEYASRPTRGVTWRQWTGAGAYLARLKADAEADLQGA